MGMVIEQYCVVVMYVIKVMGVEGWFKVQVFYDDYCLCLVDIFMMFSFLEVGLKFILFIGLLDFVLCYVEGYELEMCVELCVCVEQDVLYWDNVVVLMVFVIMCDCVVVQFGSVIFDILQDYFLLIWMLYVYLVLFFFWNDGRFLGLQFLLVVINWLQCIVIYEFEW